MTDRNQEGAVLRGTEVDDRAHGKVGGKGEGARHTLGQEEMVFSSMTNRGAIKEISF